MIMSSSTQDFSLKDDRILLKTKYKGKYKFQRYRYDEVLFLKAKERYTEITVLSDEEKEFTTHLLPLVR